MLSKGRSGEFRTANFEVLLDQSLQLLDSTRKPLFVGASVLIPRLPSWLVHDLPAEEVLLLRSVENTVMQIVDVDKYGYVWFGTENKSGWFCLRPDEVTLALP